VAGVAQFDAARWRVVSADTSYWGAADAAPRGEKVTWWNSGKNPFPAHSLIAGGTAQAEVQYPDEGGSQGERIVRWIMDCRTCGYWGPNRAA
jgi:hypothetical protein